ncbi:DUF3422 family protein [Kaustia mangrovi]|uniref:DUF3422 family protein n=1 Tax=Kaustia mangrovi TaxID=2593653 RepID=A0A7S8C410_9HYPH|nr:DUF3422 family protein [Kaustia mangrovi]QPC42998.1 DUF3422 family protein [Kaustia mangrovi]
MEQRAFAFPVAEERARALGEVHARPYVLVPSSRIIFQLAFLTENDPERDRQIMADLSRSRGVSPPDEQTSHHALAWGQGTLRWERHTEFSTYFWDAPAPARFGAEVDQHPFGDGFRPPGPLISAIRIEIRPALSDEEDAVSDLDRTSLCHSRTGNGQADIFTDFRQDGDGLTRFLVIDRGLTDASRGALVQRLLDIETYRTLAVLGLPLAQSLSPEIRAIEDRLTAITQRMKRWAREEADDMLAEITRLAAELEANAALSLYRFGASRAYYDIVRERIASLAEVAVPGHETMGLFLERRLAPAMRTCQSVEERQANLSRKLARATALLRSWIDVELQRQNASLLNSMDRRARLQLRLQQTVEGLSVAAISYYTVGLIGYLSKSAHRAGLPVDADLVTGASVPLAVIVIWLVVRTVRRRHTEAGQPRTPAPHSRPER